jgi:hypothetical protein
MEMPHHGRECIMLEKKRIMSIIQGGTFNLKSISCAQAGKFQATDEIILEFMLEKLKNKNGLPIARGRIQIKALEFAAISEDSAAKLLSQ